MGNFLYDLSQSAIDFVNLFFEFTNTLWVYPIVFFFVTMVFFLIFTANR